MFEIFIAAFTELYNMCRFVNYLHAYMNKSDILQSAKSYKIYYGIKKNMNQQIATLGKISTL